MSKLPFMPRNVADHLVSTNHLTLEELGALDRLLDNYWFQGKALENSPETLCKLLRIRPQTLRRLFPKIEGFFEVSDGRLIHPELEELIAQTLERSGKLSEAGQRGAAKRWGKNDSQANGQATDKNHGQANGNKRKDNINTLSQSVEKKATKKTPQNPSDAHRLAEYLHERILENNPSAKPDTADWTADAAAMIAAGREADDIAFVIAWAQQDDFWKSRTLSMANIRKHYDQLVLKSGLIEKREAEAREKRQQALEEERRIGEEVDEVWYKANKEEIDAAAMASLREAKRAAGFDPDQRGLVRLPESKQKVTE